MSSITASSPRLVNNKRNYPLNYSNNNNNNNNNNNSTNATATAQSHKKRSISSTIMNYFKKNPSQEASITSNTQQIDHPEPTSVSSTFVKQSQLSNLSKDSILLYESEDNSRPPVLPLLPLQRLKLLRHRQKLRLLKDSNDINILSNSNSNDEEPYISDTVIYNKSATPSPTKSSSNNLPIRLKTLRDRDQYKKRQKINTGKGSNWSAIFDYDVSKDKHNEKPIVITEQQSSDKIELPSVNIETKIIDTAKVPLTSTQRDLLQNGVKQKNTIKKSTDGIALKKPSIKLTSGATTSITTDRNLEKDKNSTVLLPTVGFDFIKNNDTPSKKSPIAKTQEKPAFSFGSKPATDKPLPKLSFGLGKPSTEESGPITKKPLSFGFTAPIPERSIDKEEDEEPKRKKRVQPDISIDLTKGADKPVFSFGQSITKTDKITPTTSTFSFGTDKKSEKDENNESPEANKSGFSFGLTKKDTNAVTKPSFSFGASLTKTTEPAATIEKVTPSFSFGVTKPIEPEKTSETKSVPSFSFGANKETTLPTTSEAPKSLFTANSSKENSTTPSFSFGAKPATPNQATETTAKPTFSFGAPAPATAPVVETEAAKPAAPSFNFSKPPASTQPNDTTAAKPAVPSFSFAAAKPPSAVTPAVSEPKPTPLFGASNTSTIPSTTPSFSFGKKPEENKSIAPSAPSTSGFSFARAPAPVSTSAGIATINPLMGNNNQSPSLGNQPQGSIAPPNTAGFNFNQQPANNTSTAPSFNFGVNNNNQANTGGSVFQSGGMGNNAGFNFGGQNQTNNTNNPPSQPSFNPSNTANFNFGSAGSDPASVFNSSGPTMQPQQIFGGAPAINNSGNVMSQNNMSNSAAGPAAFSQRKLARMRQPRR